MRQTQLIVALDFPSQIETMAFLKNFHNPIYVKVGMELFYREGMSVIEEIKSIGHQVFLDLKLHDIPNTVKSAMKNLALAEVDMVNLHAAGGKKMMQEALEGLDAGSHEKRPLCIAVTQLTSTSEEMLHQELLIEKNLEETVLHYAKMTKDSGLDGVVCSVHEVKKIHHVCGEDFLTITPGIRPQGATQDDQVRVATPSFAKQQDSDFIVVGRPITKAENAEEAYQRIAKELEGRT